MFPHFVSIIIIIGTSLFYCYILTILLMLVVFIRLWLIIWWIGIRLWRTIRWIMLSTILPIMIWFYFTKTIYLRNDYIYANCYKTCTYFWSSTNISNLFIFNKLFISMFILLERVWCTVKWPLFCCCSWTYLNIIVLIIDNDRK